MKRTIVLLLTAFLLLPGVLFAGGQQEGGEAAATTDTGDSEKELGAVINQTFEMTDPRTGEKGKTVTIDRFKASPMWKPMVESGELPPVEERVPEEPLVLKPIESIGKYGGWMVTLRTPNYLNTLSQRLQLEHLVTWTYPYFEELNPNVAKGWDVSADAKTTTFYLREGMKWSDGTPFTADAILWWFQNIISNDELYPSKPAFLTTKGNLPTVRKIDDTTIQFEFTHPNPMFLGNMARCRPMPYAPAHYLEQFHPDFTAMEEIEKEMKAAEVDIWTDLFWDKWNFYGNPDIPSICGWVPINSQEEEILKIERNPYYWKVDTEGNQLPYIDGMDHPFVQDREAWLLQAMAGELTYASSGFIGGRQNLPLLLQNREKGGYRITYGFWPPNNLSCATFNLGHPDPVKSQLIDNKNFRLALIKAIDYEETNEIIYEGEAVPSWPQSVAPYDPDDPLFVEYIGRDVEEANRLLDNMGLTDRDNEGFRLGPDGKKLTLVSICGTGWPEEAAEVAELYRGYFEAIGIRMVNKVQSNQLVGEIVEAGDYDLYFRATAPGGRPMNLFTRGALLPVASWWPPAPRYASYILSDGEEGAEPPQWVLRLREIYEDGLIEPSDATRKDMIMEAFQIYVDNVVLIPGYNQPESFSYYVVQENLRNWNISGLPHGAEHHITPSQTYYFE